MKPDISSNATFAAVVHNDLEEEKKVQFRVGCRYLPQTNFRFLDYFFCSFGNFRDLKFSQKKKSIFLALDFEVHN